MLGFTFLVAAATFTSIDAGLLGGYTAIDANDATITRFIDSGVKAIASQSLGKDGFELVNVISAEKQIVAGTNYKFVVNVRPSGCDVCNIQRCTVVVFQSLSGDEGTTVNGCQAVRDDVLRFRSKHLRTGDVKDSQVAMAAAFATEEINKMANAWYRSVLLKVTESKTEIKETMMYHMTLKMAASSCRNSPENVGKTPDECGIKTEEIQTCQVSVQVNVIKIQKYDLKHFSCTPDSNDYNCDRADFEQFKKTYSRLYDSEKEDNNRFGVFCDNMKKAAHFQLLDRGTAVYGATEFADLTEEEFKTRLTPVWDQTANDHMTDAKIPSGSIPTSFDWRKFGVVTPVKNQGSCGSCWAFSTTGNVEGQWAIRNKKLISLSEQELVDCDKVDKGCGGGLPSNAYDAIIKIGGLETEKDYPYAGSDDKCTFDKTEAVVKINGSLKISQNEQEIAAWLAKNGPISIGINAFAMQFYFGGISHPWKIFCNPASLDHGVLIVGYAVKGSEPYWIIKNSWGPSWGEQGYYWIYRGDGACGLNRMCTSSTV